MVRIRVTDRSGAILEVDAKAGEPLMYSLRTGAGVEATCGGAASCGTCHVYVEDGWTDRLSAPNTDEIDLLDGLLGVCPGSRISCQILVTEDMDGLSLAVAPEG